MNQPGISVLIPAWNAENTISAAIWSVLNQSYTDFELLICIDGATDRTVDMVAAIEDPRIRLMVEGQNKGIAQTRNRLLQAANAPYIAWLDADDIMLPGRLAAQYAWLEEHPETDLLAGWAELRNSGLRSVRIGTDTDFIETSLLFRNPLIHSSIMARNFFSSSSLQYDSRFDYTEDYDLYLRCLEAGKRFAVIPQFVVSYRMPAETEWESKKVKYHLDEKLDELLLRTHQGLDPERARAIRRFLRSSDKPDAQQFKVIRAFLVNLKRRLRKEKRYRTGVAAAMLVQRFRLVRLRFGLWRGLLLLAATKPAVVRCMLRNRIRQDKN